MEVDDGVTLFGEAAQEVGGFGEVEFATEGLGGDFHREWQIVTFLSKKILSE